MAQSEERVGRAKGGVGWKGKRTTGAKVRIWNWSDRKIDGGGGVIGPRTVANRTAKGGKGGFEVHFGKGNQKGVFNRPGGKELNVKKMGGDSPQGKIVLGGTDKTPGFSLGITGRGSSLKNGLNEGGRK